MSATLFDKDGTPLRRDPTGELVPDPDAPPRPVPAPPATCPDCGLRNGKHVVDCEIGGDQ